MEVEQLAPLLEKSPFLATVLAVVYLWRENKRLSTKLVNAYREMLAVYTRSNDALSRSLKEGPAHDEDRSHDAAGSRKVG
jgi:hypothetical protein